MALAGYSEELRVKTAVAGTVFIPGSTPSDRPQEDVAFGHAFSAVVVRKACRSNISWSIKLNVVGHTR